MRGLCGLCAMTKQNYYKGRKLRRRREIDEDFVVELVKRERCVHPNMGARKVLHLITPALEEAGVCIGRNRLYEVLGERELLVPRRRSRATTTDSRHRMRVYNNKLKSARIDGPHQAMVADLTYIRTDEGFVYLALVMDAHSRKIVGFDVNNSLEAIGCMRALRMALWQLPEGRRAIHHSDRGTQYCCADYVEMLEKRGVVISMTEENHCYENAKAERLNGVLKQEYGLGRTLAGISEAKRLVQEAVMLYNNRRPHLSLGLATPGEVHNGSPSVAA